MYFMNLLKTKVQIGKQKSESEIEINILTCISRNNIEDKSKKKISPMFLLNNGKEI